MLSRCCQPITPVLAAPGWRSCARSSTAEPDLARVSSGHCDAHLREDIELDHAYDRALLRFGSMLELHLFGWEHLGPDRLGFQRIAEWW